MNPNYPIIDADGHVLEKDRELHDYLGGRYIERAALRNLLLIFPPSTAGTAAPACPAKIRKLPAPRWLQFLDELGVHTTVLYPTGGLGFGLGAKSRMGLRARARLQFLACRSFLPR